MEKRQFTNLEIAALFRRMAAAYQILNENRFKIIAYDRAADSIEHLTSEVKDLWDDGKLGEIPGVGSQIVAHIDELFRTGKNIHFESVMKRVPQSVFPLLSVSGIGPKRAYKLITELKLKNERTVIADLEKAGRAGRIAPIEGFGDKSQEEILKNIESYKKGSVKENRIPLAEADVIAGDMTEFLRKSSDIKRIDTLGSMRRRVATVGDIDMSIVSDKPVKSVAYFCSYPHQKIIEQGPTGASILLHNGRQVDLRVQNAASYGAMLQYFTGSKNHNIALRTYALSKGMSLSEYGIKKGQGARDPSIRHLADFRGNKGQGKIIPFAKEEKFYEYMGMEWIPPELREDRGEIEAALRSAQGKPNGLPRLVTHSDIKGDMHIHTSFNLEPSHDLGANSIEEILDMASSLGYEYVGISDHNPSISGHTQKGITDIMKRREDFYRTHHEKWQKKHQKSVQLFIMLEVDIQPDGSIALPDEAFDTVDGVIASVHSSFGQDRESMTKRFVTAMTAHPKVRIIGHPTGRLLSRREGYEVNWHEVYAVCIKHGIALEINASPYRMDFPDTLVADARKFGVRFVIQTDTHAVAEMALMSYGVTVARRGWCEKRDILNTSGYNEIKHWMLKESS